MIRHPESPDMRLPILVALLAIIVAPAISSAQTSAQPLPAVPPPPPEMVPFDSALEPQVTIKRRDTDTVEEFRVRGKLYMVKVTPKIGAPYYLMDKQGNGNFTPAGTLDGNLSVPQWVVGTF